MQIMEHFISIAASGLLYKWASARKKAVTVGEIVRRSVGGGDGGLKIRC